MTIYLRSVSDELIYFEVESKSRPETHDVYFHMDNGWVCTCEHYFFRKVLCKHIKECKDWLKKDKGYTIVGITYYGVLEYNDDLINYIVNLGVYDDLIKKDNGRGYSYV